MNSVLWFCGVRRWQNASDCSFLLACSGEILEQVRQGFEAQRGEADAYAKKYLLSDGRSQLKMLRETLLMKQ